MFVSTTRPPGGADEPAAADADPDVTGAAAGRGRSHDDRADRRVGVARRLDRRRGRLLT